MNIPEQSRKFKHLLDGDIFILIMLIVSASISFSLGYLAGKDSIEEDVVIDSSAAVYEAVGEVEKNFVASVSGSKYHLPWCSGAKRIKEENKIWFSTKEDARLSGYEPAANCPGI